MDKKFNHNMGVENAMLLKEQYGYIFGPKLINRILEVGEFADFNADEIIVDYGSKVGAIPLLINGALRVLRENEQGQELLLYFIERGDTCAYSFNCCMNGGSSEIRAEAETNSKLIFIPMQYLNEWMVEFREWREFVMTSYHEKINELLEIVDSIAFQNLDERLWHYLSEKAMANKNTSFKITHQEIARDLNSSRVVISRLLKKLEHAEKVKMGRNHIELLDF